MGELLSVIVKLFVEIYPSTAQVICSNKGLGSNPWAVFWQNQMPSMLKFFKAPERKNLEWAKGLLVSAIAGITDEAFRVLKEGAADWERILADDLNFCYIKLLGE